VHRGNSENLREFHQKEAEGESAMNDSSNVLSFPMLVRDRSMGPYGVAPKVKRRTSKSTGQYTLETLKDLGRSGLDAADADVMQVDCLTHDACKEEFGFEQDGYRIPYFNFDGDRIAFSRARFTEFHEARQFGPGKNSLKKIRYTQVKGTKVYVYLPPGVDWRKVLADPSIAVVVTEGEKKAYAMCKAGILCIGLGGIWNFTNRDKSGDSTEDSTEMPDDDKPPKGAKPKKKRAAASADKEFLPELIELARSGRPITICFDSGRTTNPDIPLAEKYLAVALCLAGALPRIAIIPDGQSATKEGPDDLLVKKGHGIKGVKAIIDAATVFTARDLVAAIRKIEKSNADRHRRVADGIVQMFRGTGRFIRTDQSLIYFDNSTKMPVALDASTDQTLRAFLDDRTGVTGACQEFAVTYERLADTAITHGEKSKVSKLSRWDRASGTLYIAQSPSRMFKVSAGGWSLVDGGTDGVLIDTHRKMADVDVSKVKASRASFHSIVDVPHFIDGHSLKAKQARLLWAIYCVAMFFPEAMPTRPIPLFHGPKGSGKTSGYRAVLRTIFGSLGQVTVINPKKVDALESVLINDAIAALDNIDGRHVDLQIALATAATGGTLKCRTLYTTMGGSEFVIECFVGATSNDPKSFTRDDVVDRLLYYPVARRDTFMPESELIAMVDENRPKFWRWLLDTLPAVIEALTKAKAGMQHQYRMADFAGFAFAVGPVLGFPVAEVAAALSAMNAERLNFQFEHSPVLGALAQYVESRVATLAEWGGTDHDNKDHGPPNQKGYDALVEGFMAPRTAKQLLEGVKSVVHALNFTHANTFGQALRNEQTAIEAKFRFEVSDDKKEKVKMYKIAPPGGYPTFEAHQKRLKELKSKAQTA
jgi:hypothetical protein